MSLERVLTHACAEQDGIATGKVDLLPTESIVFRAVNEQHVMYVDSGRWRIPLVVMP